MQWIEKVLTAPGTELDPWMVIPRTAIVFLVAVIYVRWAKKRFIAQASALDLVLAVVFGSVLSRGINGSATLLSTLVGAFCMILFHRIVIHFAARNPKFFNLVKGHREIVFEDGKFRRDTMHIHDVTEEDVRQELRTMAQTEDLELITKAVLERSGRISVLLRERTKEAQEFSNGA